MTFAYERPKTADDLVTSLAQAGGRASILAGGTDLLVQLRNRLVSPEIVLDIKGIAELTQVHHYDDGRVSLGGAVVMNRIADDQRLGPICTGMAQAARQIASFAIRNRATLAGNIANASPCADTVPVLCVLGATIELRSKTGTRHLAVSDFIRGVRATVRRHDEFIYAVHIPTQSAATRTLFRKRTRNRGHDLALANAAILRDPDTKRLRVAIGSCSPVPVLVVLDDLFASMDIEEACRRASAAILPISDVRASAEYRKDMTAMLVRGLMQDVCV